MESQGDREAHDALDKTTAQNPGLQLKVENVEGE